MTIASKGFTHFDRERFRIFRVSVNLLAVTVCLKVALLHSDPAAAFQGKLEKVESPVPGAKLINPQSMGFDIPADEIVASPIKAVTTRDESGRQVVAKVHVRVGENFVVMLPDGQLVARKPGEIQVADEEDFEPATHDEIAGKMMVGQLEGFNYEKSRNYVFIYNTSDEFFKATKRILESMCAGVERYFKGKGIETHDPEIPLVVVMFQREFQFQEFEKMPPGVLAYYDIVANRIVLHEESPLAATRPDLARGQLLSNIAHEGAHQILHNIGVQQRFSVWPMWVGEGIAEYLAPTEFSRSNRWKGAAKINDLRMWELEMFLQIQFIKGFNGDSVKGVILDRKLDSTGYATAWSIIHYLGRHHKDEFFEYVKLLSEMGPLHGMSSRDDEIPENLEHFKKYFGEDLEQIEQDMVKHMSKQDYDSPVGGFPHYVATVAYGGKRQACFFHTQELALRWREAVEENMTVQERRRASWDLQQFGNRGIANQYIKAFLK